MGADRREALVITFRVSLIDSPEDAVAVTRYETDGERCVVILATRGMSCRLAGAMAATLLTEEERAAYQQNSGFPPLPEDVEPAEDVPVDDSLIAPAHRVVTTG